MLLFYVRHGDPIYNPDSLTELGRIQAEALVSRMKRCAPERIFASSSNRAIQTAEPSAKALGLDIEILDWCNEAHAARDFFYTGDIGSKGWIFAQKEMKPTLVSEEVQTLYRDWYTHPKFSKMPNLKRGIDRVQKETDDFLLSLGYRHEGNGYIAEKPNNSRIALFAHQGFGMIFLSCLLDIPYPIFSTHFDLSHSSVTAIEFSGDDFVVPKVLQLSNDSHLFASGVKTEYNNYIEF